MTKLRWRLLVIIFGLLLSCSYYETRMGIKECGFILKDFHLQNLTLMKINGEVILNIKNLVIQLQGQGPKEMTVSADKAGVVTARDITADPAIEVINKDMALATLTKDTNFNIEMVV